MTKCGKMDFFIANFQKNKTLKKNRLFLDDVITHGASQLVLFCDSYISLTS